MAKEFKDYDKMFSQAEIETVRKEYDLAELEKFKHGDTWGVNCRRWSHEQVAEAVYNSSGARNWQLFRVSLKGLTTCQKLDRLYAYLHKHLYNEDKGDIDRHVQCRVDNYIGALRRGGQLDATFRIVK